MCACVHVYDFAEIKDLHRSLSFLPPPHTRHPQVDMLLKETKTRESNVSRLSQLSEFSGGSRGASQLSRGPDLAQDL